MFETQTACWCYDRLFVKLAPVSIIADNTKRLYRFGNGFRRPRIKLHPVTHGCSLTPSELTGMRAIRAAMLLVTVNMHEATGC